MSILSIDVGGSHVKLLLSGCLPDEARRADSGHDMGPWQMVSAVRELANGWVYEAVSIGYPGPVRQGRPAADPWNLGGGWVDFDFRAALERPVKVVNDAAMQALGSYEGGRMLFLGLGTGLGSAFVVDGVLVPLELAHLPYRKKRSYEDWLGESARRELGKKEWRRAVADVSCRLRDAFLADYVVLGGGNVKHLEELPPHCRRGDNDLAFLGGFRLWDGTAFHAPDAEPG